MKIIRPLLFLLGFSAAAFGQTSPASPEQLKSQFEAHYLDVLRRSLGAIGSEDVVQFWERAHQIVFGQRQNDDIAAQEAMDLFATAERYPRTVYQPLSPDLPLYTGGSAGSRMEQELEAALATLQASEHPTEADRQQVREKLTPFLRTLQADLASRTGALEVPANTLLVYEAKPYCLQHDLPAPGAGDPMWLIPSSALIPPAAQPLFAALLAYSAQQPRHESIVQTLLWAIREADEHPLTQLSADQRRVLDAALPEGAAKFLAFMEGKPADTAGGAGSPPPGGPRRPRPPVDDIYGPAETCGTTSSDPYAVSTPPPNAGGGTPHCTIRTLDDSKRELARRNREKAGIVNHGCDWRDPEQVQRIIAILLRPTTPPPAGAGNRNPRKPTDGYTRIAPKVAIRTTSLASLSCERIEILNASTTAIQIDLASFVALTRENRQPFAITTVTRVAHTRVTLEAVTVARRIVERTTLVLQQHREAVLTAR